MPDSLSPDRILQTGMGFWASKTLLSAVEIGVFTELARAPSSCETLQKSLGLHPRGARDFLDALTALGFLTRTDGLYGNSPESALFLDRGKPSYIGGILEMAGSRLYAHWNHLTEALRTGQPQNEMKGGGQGPFQSMYADPARLKTFLSAMSGVSRGANMTIARSFPWAQYGSFADIGTAQGDLAVQIALAQPHLRGTGFDLPEVEPIFREYVTAADVCARLAFQAGDFFKQDLPKADVILMGHILHDWDLPTKQMLVKKAYDALPARGAFIAYDAVIDDARIHNAFGLLMSLNMLIETPGGFDYTGAECTQWMKEAGFSAVRIEPLVGPDSMVIGIK